jgi:hypothetical protein
MSETTNMYVPEHYPYKTEFNAIEKFLFFCAGADIELLKKCPRYDQTKQIGLGGVVLATTVVALAVGFYAFKIIFEPKDLSPDAATVSGLFAVAAFVVGSIWALIIFNLDRFIVSVSGPGDGSEGVTWGEIGRALPRLLLAAIIGFTLSKPLEIKIMESEIKSKIIAEQKEIKDKLLQSNIREYEAQRRDYEKLKIEALEEKKKLESYRDSFRATRDTAETNYRNEERGAAGTGKAGFGEATKRREATYKLAQDEYDRVSKETGAKLEILEKRINSLDLDLGKLSSMRDLAEKTSVAESKENDGLVKRIMVAHELYPTASIIITVLFIVIELCPVLFKMLIPASTYDYLKENAKRMSLAENGIEIQANYTDNEKLSKQTLELATYSKPDTKNTEITKRLNIERQLTEQAQEEFKKMVSADISANPEKYVKLEEKSPKT